MVLWVRRALEGCRGHSIYFNSTGPLTQGFPGRYPNGRWQGAGGHRLAWRRAAIVGNPCPPPRESLQRWSAGPGSRKEDLQVTKVRWMEGAKYRIVQPCLREPRRSPDVHMNIHHKFQTETQENVDSGFLWEQGQEHELGLVCYILLGYL